jgi:hypothetical protein
MIIPDCAVALDRKREAHPFRSKVDGFLPVRRIEQRCFDGTLKLVTTKCESAKMTLKLYSWTPSLLQGSTSLAVSSV